jgi:tRNA 2-thiouridine synthesizing protein A
VSGPDTVGPDRVGPDTVGPDTVGPDALGPDALVPDALVPDAPRTLVEARGVLCPVPIIRLARAARALPPGSIIELLSDDPAAEHDVPAWCRLRGHTLLVTQLLDAAASAPPGRHPQVDVEGDEPAVGSPALPAPLRHLIRLEATEPTP